MTKKTNRSFLFRFKSSDALSHSHGHENNTFIFARLVPHAMPCAPRRLFLFWMRRSGRFSAEFARVFSRSCASYPHRFRFAVARFNCFSRLAFLVILRNHLLTGFSYTAQPPRAAVANGGGWNRPKTSLSTYSHALFVAKVVSLGTYVYRTIAPHETGPLWSSFL